MIRKMQVFVCVVTFCAIVWFNLYVLIGTGTVGDKLEGIIVESSKQIDVPKVRSVFHMTYTI